MAKTSAKRIKSPKQKTSTSQKKRTEKVVPTSSSGGAWGLWWVLLSAFLGVMALPLLMGRLATDTNLPTAYLAPLALWCGTALFAFWFTRPSRFTGDRSFVAITLLLFGLGVVEQMRLASFQVTWEVWRAYAPMLAGAGGFLFCLRFLKASHIAWLLNLKVMKWGLWLGIMAVLGALLCFGRRYRGGIFLPGQINPTELVKLFAVLLGASLLPTLKDRFWRLFGFPMPDWKALICLGFFWGAPLLGVVMVSDLGLLLILSLTFVVMLSVLTASPLWLLFGVTGAAASGVAICQISAHTATRFAIWQNPFADPLGKGYQILQSLCAMNAGGLTGAGLDQGMPGSVPIVTSDFVYAAVAEEWGLVGCALLLGLYSLWLHAIFRTGSRAETMPLKLASYGIGAVLAVQIILNIGGVTKALPMTGITLPFLSHGGFSLLAVFLLCGVAAALSKQTK